MRRYLLMLLCLVMVRVVVAADSLGSRQSLRPLAIASSALLPGTGQLMLGSHKRGEALLWLDGAAAVAWAGLRWYGSTREQEARLAAAREAGANLAERESRYYKALEAYDNADEYNEKVRADARSRFPNDPAAQHAYYDSVGYFGASVWDWSSDSARIRYWQTRRSGRSAVQAAGFVVAGMVLNRLASVIDCAFFVRAEGRNSHSSTDRQRRWTVCQPVERLGLELAYRF